MRKFITNIMERVSRFIGRRPHVAADPMLCTVMGESGIRIPPGRLDTALLTSAGIRINGIRYHNTALAELPLKPGSWRRVPINWDPSDASCIQVLDRAIPGEIKWITVQAAGLPAPMSFAEFARLREFARSQGIAFNTEAERSEALERLKGHWERLPGLPPLRAHRIASEWDGPVADEIDTLAATEDMPLAPESRPRARKPRKSALLKAKRTKSRKAAEAKTKVPTRISRSKRK